MSIKTDDAQSYGARCKEARGCLEYPFRLEKQELYDESPNTFYSHIVVRGDEIDIVLGRAAKHDVLLRQG